jgi:hypothetical protein
MQADASYGLWLLVLLNTALFAIFAASFLHPRTARDWKAMYTFNQYRGTEEATESYGHQIEAELSNFDFTLFTTKFETRTIRHTRRRAQPPAGAGLCTTLPTPARNATRRTPPGTPVTA